MVNTLKTSLIALLLLLPAFSQELHAQEKKRDWSAGILLGVAAFNQGIGLKTAAGFNM